MHRLSEELAKVLRQSDALESIVRNEVLKELGIVEPAVVHGHWENLTLDDMRFLHELKIDID